MSKQDEHIINDLRRQLAEERENLERAKAKGVLIAWAIIVIPTLIWLSL